MTTRYRYRASGPDGSMVEGVKQAPSRRELFEELHREELYPVSVEEVADRERDGGSRLGRREALAVWARNTAVLLSAGVPLGRTLRVTADISGHEELSAALRRTRERVEGGATLADALGEEPLVPELVVAMVSAGEASGALDAVFERAAEYLEEVAELRSEIRSSLLYPALMAVVASLGVIVLLFFVVPRFTQILTEVGGELPFTTRTLVAGSAFLADWWWLLLAAAAGGAWAARSALQREDTRRRWHAARLGWPWIGGIEEKYATASFTRTLGMLLRSGVPLLTGMEIARAAVLNLELKRGLGRARKAVAQGSRLREALRGVLPPLALEMIAVGEESGRLEEVCLRVSETYDRDVRRSVRSAVSMIEPAMILVFGVLVGYVALAMLQAIYSVNASAF